MNIIKNQDAVRFKNSSTCTAIEYDFKTEKDFNIAAIELNGRYPEQGYAQNSISKELIYIKNGKGVLVTDTQNFTLEPGDTVLVKPKEKYFFEGNLELIICSSPAWHPDQYRNILD